MQNQIDNLRNADSGQAEINKLTDMLAKANDTISDLQKQLDELKKNPVVTTPDDNTSEEPDKAPDKLSTPVFTMYKTIYLGYKYRIQLSNTKGYKVSFQSSDDKIAKVDKSGIITSVKKGKAIITCTVGNSYTYKIVVTAADGKGSATLNLIAPNIQTTGSTPTLLMYKQVKKGSSTQLKLSGLDNNAEVTYVNANSNVAAISMDGTTGTITGVQKGNTDVLAIVTQGNQHYIYYIKIRVDDGTKDSDMWEYLTAS